MRCRQRALHVLLGCMFVSTKALILECHWQINWSLSACRQRCAPIVISSAALQASLLTAPGGTYFSSPLGVALSSYMEEPQCRAALVGALNVLAASGGARQLAQPGAPDQQPDVALVIPSSLRLLW